MTSCSTRGFIFFIWVYRIPPRILHSLILHPHQLYTLVCPPEEFHGSRAASSSSILSSHFVFRLFRSQKKEEKEGRKEGRQGEKGKIQKKESTPDIIFVRPSVVRYSHRVPWLYQKGGMGNSPLPQRHFELPGFTTPIDGHSSQVFVKICCVKNIHPAAQVNLAMQPTKYE